MAYIGRSGWNTLRLGGAIPDDEIREAVDASYETIVAKLPKSRRPAAGLLPQPCHLARGAELGERPESGTLL